MSENTEPLPKVRQLPLNQIVADLLDVIKDLPFDEGQILALYDAIRARKIQVQSATRGK